ncbi:similar to Kazachstania africana KAFR_0L01140 hypothetical protein [Maudiozyma barnettii]|uniref:CCHC-type domain-containing protein n=1 Tax=Maudiozyma barnettii TaxID=61262 RepID=A0A8H2VED5_9SACH|nr:uncharacterized protein KABA2_03S10076 [Kazachstania barnettii]CAB4253996.1 similar to Kazachstania africana KAFR_0L01140 hypothetical protein [Kazachstania barnettii]CAD1781746.1 similar to Kazachstania africana KAFR_0L01140 hypothetical protein [Kazachstania barnettii]
MAKLEKVRSKDRRKVIRINKKSNKKHFKCKICQNNEHRTKNCPRTLCEHCGQMKAHHSNIGSNSLCSNLTVSTKRQEIDIDESEFCTTCQSYGHVIDRCPSIWRAYVTRPVPSENPSISTIPMHTLFCYNCGEKGHYGDDCHIDKHTEKMKYQKSAFSGKNLPSVLEPIYYNNLNSIDNNVQSSLISKQTHKKVGHFFPPPYKNLREPEFSEEFQLLG